MLIVSFLTQVLPSVLLGVCVNQPVTRHVSIKLVPSIGALRSANVLMVTRRGWTTEDHCAGSKVADECFIRFSET